MRMSGSLSRVQQDRHKPLQGRRAATHRAARVAAKRPLGQLHADDAVARRWCRRPDGGAAARSQRSTAGRAVTAWHDPRGPQHPGRIPGRGPCAASCPAGWARPAPDSPRPADPQHGQQFLVGAWPNISTPVRSHPGPPRRIRHLTPTRHRPVGPFARREPQRVAPNHPGAYAAPDRTPVSLR